VKGPFRPPLSTKPHGVSIFWAPLLFFFTPFAYALFSLWNALLFFVSAFTSLFAVSPLFCGFPQPKTTPSPMSSPFFAPLWLFFLDHFPPWCRTYRGSSPLQTPPPLPLFQYDGGNPNRSCTPAPSFPTNLLFFMFLRSPLGLELRVHVFFFAFFLFC